jgi:hypothetical protein
MATDFRSGAAFPRRGREVYGGFNWLVRVFDRSVFEFWGVTSAEFDAALDTCTTDEAILAWLNARVTPAQRDAANAYVLVERLQNLDRQDAEEGVAA